jgi:hypothetical protein
MNIVNTMKVFSLMQGFNRPDFYNINLLDSDDQRGLDIFEL